MPKMSKQKKIRKFMKFFGKTHLNVLNIFRNEADLSLNASKRHLSDSGGEEPSKKQRIESLLDDIK